MTDVEPCQSPTYHQRHRWMDGPNEVKCPGRDRPAGLLAPSEPPSRPRATPDPAPSHTGPDAPQEAT